MASDIFIDAYCSKWTFPFKSLPYSGATWRKWGCIFGAKRDGGERAHAGCDVLKPHKTSILAISDGKVLDVQTYFTGKKKGYRTDALVVEHDTYVIRYGEIEPGSAKKPDGKHLKTGDKVYQGDVIAKVGYVGSDQMLHFEIYWSDGGGPLSDKSNKGKDAFYPWIPQNYKNRNFMRRMDLMNPTEYLDLMAQNSGFGGG